MSTRDTGDVRDPDDWFVGSDAARIEAGARVPPPLEDGGDDWLGDPSARVDRDAPFGVNLSTRSVAIVAGVLLAGCLLVGGLVLAGVFGATKHRPAAAPTTHRTPTRASTTAASPPPAATAPPPTATLKPGDTGTQVELLQRALVQLGYAAGKVDGNYGPATTAAVKQFQSASKLTADGVLGPLTLAALVSALRGP